MGSGGRHRYVPPTMTDTSRTPPIRSDAVSNREEILRTAALVVNRQGPHVPMARFAEAAGVGVGTLYRHFPSREDLVGALQLRSFEYVRDAARDAAGLDASAPEAVQAFLHAVIRQRDSLVMPLKDGLPLSDPALPVLQAEIRSSLRAVIDRGQVSGTVREDAAVGDVIVFGAMLSQQLPYIGDWEATAQRLVALFVRGISCEGAPAGDSATAD